MTKTNGYTVFIGTPKAYLASYKVTASDRHQARTKGINEFYKDKRHHHRNYTKGYIRSSFKISVIKTT